MRLIGILLLGATLLLARPGGAAELVVTVSDGDGKPVADAVVGLARPGLAPPTPGSPPTPQVVDQRNETFIPLVTVVPRGGEVAFRNSDLTRHHVYSFSSVRSFEFVLAPGEGSDAVRFDRPGVVAIGCNIHDRMVAYVYVTELPFTALTDKAGRARFVDLPAGDYVMHTWHPRLRPGRPEPTQPVALGAETAQATVSLGLLAEPGRALSRERQRY